MDRHLIYPPGWDKRTNEWDADPSLKGWVIRANYKANMLLTDLIQQTDSNPGDEPHLGYARRSRSMDC